MKWLVAGCALCASACLPLKGYTGAGDGGVDAVVVGDATAPPISPIGSIHDVKIESDHLGGYWATGPGYGLHFADTAPHYPDRFLVGTEDVLAQSTHCADASLMGTSIYPAIRSDAPGDEAMVDVTLVSPGPNVARLVIGWQAPLGGSCGLAGVTTSWTFFPDGRILRYDSVTGGQSGATACSCDGTTMFVPKVETLYTAHAAGFMTNSSGATVIPSATGDGTAIDDLTCMRSNDFNLYTSDGPSPHPQVFPGEGGAVGIVYELSTNGSVSGGGMSNIIVASSAETCNMLRTSAGGYLAPPPVSLNGQAAQMPTYDGTGFEPVTNSATIKVPGGLSPRGMAVGLAFDGPYMSFSIKKNNGAMPLDASQARVQIMPGTSNGILWVAGQFGGTDEIEVLAQ